MAASMKVALLKRNCLKSWCCRQAAFRQFSCSSVVFVRNPNIKCYDDEGELVNPPRNARKQPVGEKGSLTHETSEANRDFFGLKGTEGVVIVNSPVRGTKHAQEKFSYLTRKNINPSEQKFYEAPYGTFRFDFDNQPKYHGQYENSESTGASEIDTELTAFDKFSKVSKTTHTEHDFSSDPVIRSASRSLQHLSDERSSNIKNMETSVLKHQEHMSFVEDHSPSVYDENSNDSYVTSLISNAYQKNRLKGLKNTEALESNVTTASEPDPSLDQPVDRIKAVTDRATRRSILQKTQTAGVHPLEDVSSNHAASERLKGSNFEHEEFAKEIRLGDVGKDAPLSPSQSVKFMKGAENHISDKKRSKLYEEQIQDEILNESFPERDLSLLKEKNVPYASEKQQIIRSLSGNFLEDKKQAKNLPIDPDSDDEQPATAYEYLKQQKSTSANEKNLDSKGFRLPSSDIKPNIANMLHDEVLRLLKKSVLFNEHDIVIINKPYGMVCHGPSSHSESCILTTYLDELAMLLDKTRSLTNPKLYTVHRLDREVSGVLVLAKTQQMADILQTMFRKRSIIKTYVAITKNVPPLNEGIIDMPITEGSVDKKKRMVLAPRLEQKYELLVPKFRKAKEAITKYRVLSTNENAALVELQPETGVKHQLRVHLGFGLRCCILGDHKYSELRRLVPQKLPADILKRLGIRQSKARELPLHLHALSIIIPEIADGQNVIARAPLPYHFAVNMKRLKLKH